MLKAIIEKLQAIKELARLSYFDMALDIGIAENTLYRFMHGGNVTSDTLNKINEYLGGC